MAAIRNVMTGVVLTRTPRGWVDPDGGQSSWEQLNHHDPLYPGYAVVMTEIRKGEYTLTNGYQTGVVYRGEQKLGHFWDDPKSGGYAVFVHGRSSPVARPKSVRGCVLKLTAGEWDGTAEESN